MHLSSHQKVYQAISQIKLKDLVTSVIFGLELNKSNKDKGKKLELEWRTQNRKSRAVI